MKTTIEIIAKPEKSQELYQVLLGLLPVIQKHRGCRSCRVYRESEGGDIFFLEVEWDGTTAMQQFMATVGGAALLGAIDLLGKDGRIKIGNDESWEEIDNLKEMRKKKPLPR
jgi:quinol monooxygenase YgiN